MYSLAILACECCLWSVNETKGSRTNEREHGRAVMALRVAARRAIARAKKCIRMTDRPTNMFVIIIIL